MNRTDVMKHATRSRGRSLRLLSTAATILCLGTGLSTLAHAGAIGLTIDATFDPSLTSAEQAAIDDAIQNVENNIASPNNITVSIYFNSMVGGLGESLTTTETVSYFDYYNNFSAVATQPNQLTALASLGVAPTSDSSGNPVNGNPYMIITAPEARNLGFSAAGIVDQSNGLGLVNGSGTYDAAIGLNTSITSPPNSTDSGYGLQATAAHEIDEVLGIGGSGSTIPLSYSGDPLTGPVGDLDLFRYSAPGVRSYSNIQDTSPYAYFSINGGITALSYFNQTDGADYGDWLSNPIPNGFGPQVQDAYGSYGSDPTLGPNEITALNVIGYEVIAPEPSSIALIGIGLAGLCLRRRRQSAGR